MLEAVDGLLTIENERYAPALEAIRAILEGHRPPPPSLAEARRAFLIEERYEVAIEAIRAFVERVKCTLKDNAAVVNWQEQFWHGCMEELAAMEKETNVL